MPQNRPIPYVKIYGTKYSTDRLYSADLHIDAEYYTLTLTYRDKPSVNISNHICKSAHILYILKKFRLFIKELRRARIERLEHPEKARKDKALDLDERIKQAIESGDMLPPKPKTIYKELSGEDND